MTPGRLVLSQSGFDARQQGILQRAESRGRVSMTCSPNPEPYTPTTTADVVVATAGTGDARAIKMTMVDATEVNEYGLKVITPSAIQRIRGDKTRLYRKQ